MDKIPVIYDEKIAKSVADSFLVTGAYKVELERNQENYFTWKNGVKAPIYCDCRVLTTNPEESSKISRYLTYVVDNEFSKSDVVISLATAGITWGSAVASNLRLPFGYVRSSSKSHGCGQMTEGIPIDSKHSVIIDDLVSGGGSVKKSIDNLKNERNVSLDGLISIVNWNFPQMNENVKESGIEKVYALTSYPYLLESAAQHKLISLEQAQDLLEFYQSPFEFDFEEFKKKYKLQKEKERKWNQIEMHY